MRYNGAGAVEEIRDFDGNTMSWTYDKINKPVVYRDKAGRVTHMSYDIMWNMTEKVLPDGGKITYTYDLLQRLQQETDQAGGVRTYSYDKAGRLLCETDEAGGKTSYCYNAMGQPETITDAAGRTIKTGT